MSIDHNSLWLITGCSSGLGESLAREVIARGYRLLATARDPATLADLVALAPDRVRALALDVTDPASVSTAVARAEAWGGVDVLVNNAGHGYLAAVEEGEEARIRALFDVNVFGVAALIRALLPGMRERRRGHIVNVGSMSGFVGGAGSAYYAASKFALEGLSDALADEVAPFDIGVTVVEPGPVRTAFAGRSMAASPAIAAYEETAGKRRRSLLALDGKQAGDPARIATLIVDALESPKPPLRLIVGEMAMTGIARKLDAVREAIEAWRERSARTDFE